MAIEETLASQHRRRLIQQLGLYGVPLTAEHETAIDGIVALLTVADVPCPLDYLADSDRPAAVQLMAALPTTHQMERFAIGQPC